MYLNFKIFLKKLNSFHPLKIKIFLKKIKCFEKWSSLETSQFFLSHTTLQAEHVLNMIIVRKIVLFFTSRFIGSAFFEDIEKGGEEEHFYVHTANSSIITNFFTVLLLLRFI
jgi:hypothetical protein